MKKTPKRAAAEPEHPAMTAVRFDAEDWRLIDALRKKSGTKNVSDLIRRALRSLAREEKLP